jgi:C4-dicarboxylate transporter, DctQ subunit
MKLLWKLWDLILEVLAAMSAVVIAVMAFGICYDVLLRSLGVRGGALWVFDFVEYGVLFVTCAMAAYISRAQRHVEVDLLLMLVPNRMAWAMRIFSAVIVTGISATLFYFALQATLQSINHGSFIFRAILIPEWLPFGAIATMFFSLTVEGLRRVHTRILDTESRIEAPSEKSF